MGFKSSSLLCLALVLAFSSAINGFDITKLLGKYPEFGLFNQYLTETKLAEQINKRNTITVLALDNSALSSLSGKSQETIKAIIGTHILLDYYDEQRLMIAQGSHTQLVTLFQASGLAKNNQGFIYVALINEGEIAFGSAVQGSPFNTKLVKTVTTQPYNISILQVSEPIIAPGIDALAGSSSSSSSSSSSPPPAAVGATAPVASNKPAPEEEVAESPEEEAVTPSDESGAAADGEEESHDDHSSSCRTTQIGLVGAVVMALPSLLVSL